MYIISASDNMYKVQFPGGAAGYIAASNVTGKPLRSYLPETEIRLLDEPLSNAPSKTFIAKGNPVNVMGTFGNYYLAEYNNMTGWISNR